MSTEKQKEIWRKASRKYALKNKHKCFDCERLVLKKALRCNSCNMSNLQKGRKKSEEHKRKIGKSNTAEKNGQWKGDDVGYHALHKWVEKRKQKPEFCECCNKRKVKDLANISQKYLRDIKDFEWLCRSCHMRKDGRINNLRNVGDLQCQ